jgi:hypothetical protein
VRSSRGDGLWPLSAPESLVDVKAITLVRREGIDGLRFACRNFGSCSLLAGSLSFTLGNLLKFRRARPASFRLPLQPLSLRTLFRHALACLFGSSLRLLGTSEFPLGFYPQALSFTTLAVALHLPTLGDRDDDKDDKHECASDKQTP